MNNIAICIPTYKRPILLEKLLLSLRDSVIDSSLIGNIDIVVVDNDAGRTGESTVTKLSDIFTKPFIISYSVHSEKGLANVRNELLKKALEKNPDFIVFIDDDEFADKEWLTNLIAAITRTKGDVVRGPVTSIFDDSVPPYIRYWFDRIDYIHDSKINAVATNNLVIRTTSFLKYNVWFDKRFNFTGSEDSYFGLQLLRKGASVHWAADAIVYESIPPSRTTLKWIMRRRYMGGANFVYKLKLDKKYPDLVKKFILSLIYIVAGFFALVLFIFPVRKKYWGAIKMAEGIGGIAGTVNIRKTAY